MSKELIQVLAQRPACTGSGMYLQSFHQEARTRNYNQQIIAAAQEGSAESDCSDFMGDFVPVQFLSTELPFPTLGMSDNMPYRSRRYSSLTESEKEKVLGAYLDKTEQVVTNMDDPTILAHHLWLVTSAVAEKFKNIKVIGISHGTGLRQLQKNPKFAPEVKKGVARLDRIFALNQHQKQEIIDKFDVTEEKIEITGLGYNHHNFYFPVREELKMRKERKEKEIVYVGKLSRSKGVLSLLRAVEKLDFESLKLTLIGSGRGEEKGRIVKLAEEVSFPVELTGLLEQEKVGERLRKANIFCLPSFYEGFALVILEALACGLRVVTSDIPGVADYLPDIIEQKSALAFVELPPLADVDIPAEQDLKSYEKRLSAALEKQILQDEDFSFLEDENYLKAVRSLSWSGVFENLEKYF